MAKITDVDGVELTEKEQIAVMVALGMTESYARFVLAMQRGEIDGDVVMVDKDGREVKSKE